MTFPHLYLHPLRVKILHPPILFSRLAGHDHYPFCNTSMPLDDRVRDLVSRIKDVDKPNLLTARGHTRRAGGQQALPELGVPAYYWGQVGA